MFKTYNTAFLNLISATTTGQKIQFAQDALVGARSPGNQLIVMDNPQYVISLNRLAYTLAFTSGNGVFDGGKICVKPFQQAVEQILIISEDTLDFVQSLADLYGLTPVANQVTITFVNTALLSYNLDIGSNSNTFNYVSFLLSGGPPLPASSKVVLFVLGDAVGTAKNVTIAATFDLNGAVQSIQFAVGT